MSGDEPVVIAMSPCFVCHRPFYFNPIAVPSMTPPGKTYREREPICEDCMTAINAKRATLDLPPIPVRPDAYEPLPAELLP